MSAGTNPDELCGFKLGQKIWCKTQQGNIVFGQIICLYPTNDEGPAASVMDEFTGSHRVVLVVTMTEDPPKGGQSRLNRAKAKHVQKNRR